jgi:hypothetical protein
MNETFGFKRRLPRILINGDIVDLEPIKGRWFLVTELTGEVTTLWFETQQAALDWHAERMLDTH